MLASDLGWIATHPDTLALKDLVLRYGHLGLPVMNGSFLYSNFREGSAQILTCNLYRTWEYISLFEIVRGRTGIRRFLDVGGACSPLPFLLAERGYEGLSVEVQPILVEVCNFVASQRRLTLRAVHHDLSGHGSALAAEPFDLVTMISVLEHIPVTERTKVIAGASKYLRPGGLFYLTFDYGTFEEHTAYRSHGEQSISLRTIDELARMLPDAQLEFVGNDPRDLPKEVLDSCSAPGHQNVAWHYRMNQPVFDGETPWGTIGRYVMNRAVGRWRRCRSRFERHNFFRVLLTKTA